MQSRSKFIIPWKDGFPDLTLEEQRYCIENNVGFSGAEELNHEMPENKALVWIFAEPEIMQVIKDNPKFEWVEDSLPDQM